MKRPDLALPSFDRTARRAASRRAGLRAVLALSFTLATNGARADEPATPAQAPLGEVAPPVEAAPPETTAATAPTPAETAPPVASAPSATTAPAAPARQPPATATVDPERSHPACPNCCQASVDAAARIGLSINGDQWLSGGQIRTSFPCLGRLGLGPLLVLGVGGNHITFRSAFRLDYLFWLDRAHNFGVYPAVGAAVLFYLPVGNFAEFCHRVALDECSGYLFGAELGGGLRYRRFSVDAFAGFGGLPVLSIMAVLHFSLTGPEDR